MFPSLGAAYRRCNAISSRLDDQFQQIAQVAERFPVRNVDARNRLGKT
jgi:hypothetical protein